MFIFIYLFCLFLLCLFSVFVCLFVCYLWVVYENKNQCACVRVRACECQCECVCECAYVYINYLYKQWDVSVLAVVIVAVVIISLPLQQPPFQYLTMEHKTTFNEFSRRYDACAAVSVGLFLCNLFLGSVCVVVSGGEKFVRLNVMHLRIIAMRLGHHRRHIHAFTQYMWTKNEATD